jgi:hypothetical protein
LQITGASQLARAPSFFNCSNYFSHPEQEAQQSGESQHDAFAAFTAPAKPSAITANNRIALILFMNALLLRWKELLSADSFAIGA